MELMGYCEPCDKWTEFIGPYTNQVCERGHKFSTKVGQQVTSKRTWKPTTKRGKR